MPLLSANPGARKYFDYYSTQTVVLVPVQEIRRRFVYNRSLPVAGHRTVRQVLKHRSVSTHPLAPSALISMTSTSPSTLRRRGPRRRRKPPRYRHWYTMQNAVATSALHPQIHHAGVSLLHRDRRRVVLPPRRPQTADHPAPHRRATAVVADGHRSG